MKKLYAILLLLVLSFSLVACDPTTSQNLNDTASTYFSDGSYCYYNPGNQVVYSIKSLPFDITVEEKAVPLIKTSFFELHENHGYTGYFVATLDRSNLSDDDVYWITKYDSKKLVKTFDMNAYVDSAKNDLDTSRLNYLGCVYDNQHIYFSFSTDSYRYSFLDSIFGCQFIYTPTSITAEDTVTYYYDHIVTSENYADSIDALSAGERNALIQAMAK